MKCISMIGIVYSKYRKMYILYNDKYQIIIIKSKVQAAASSVSFQLYLAANVVVDTAGLTSLSVCQVARATQEPKSGMSQK